MKQHDQFDQFTHRWLTDNRAAGRVIYCRDGCAGCCHLAVHASFPEAVAVAARLNEQQSISLAGYIQRVKDVLPQLVDLKSYLKNHRQALGPCAFLDAHGSCSIYPIRPLSCRALLSTRPAAWCTVDFSELDDWDKQAYTSSLDRRVVAWPTHYVAATQDLGREMETDLLKSMQQDKGWSMSGNFAVMVWLEQQCRLSDHEFTTAQQVHDQLAACELDHPLLLNITAGRPEPASPG